MNEEGNSWDKHDFQVIEIVGSDMSEKENETLRTPIITNIIIFDLAIS